MSVLKGRPLLLIEDNDFDAGLLVECLRSVGVTNEIHRCADGAAIEKYLAQAKTLNLSQQPVFVFLDLNLPGAEGLKVLERLKAEPSFAAVPVVVLTTSARPNDVDQAYRSGAAGFITKPIDLDKFESMVRQVTNYWFSAVKLPENVTRTKP